MAAASFCWGKRYSAQPDPEHSGTCPEEDEATYVYQYRDHLGNVRLSYREVEDPSLQEVFADGLESASGWDGSGSTWGSPVSAFDSSFKRTGNHSARLEPQQTTQYDTAAHSNDWVAIDNAQDTFYTFSAWVYLEDLPDNTSRMFLFMKTDQETGYYTEIASVQTDTRGQWALLEKTVLVPQHIDRLNLRIDNRYGGRVWYDDLRITRGNPLGAQVVEENHYYPFGLRHKGYNDVVSGRNHKFDYNGMEREEALGLNMMEMEMRHFDPAIARWVVMDPITHHSMSPYTGFDNNPIYWADPSGADSWKYVGNGQYRNNQTGETTDDWKRAINETQSHYGEDQDTKPKFRVNINNSESIEGTHVKISGEASFGIQFKEGVTLFGFGEKIDAGLFKTIASADLLFSPETGFVLNINLPPSVKEFLEQNHEFVVGGTEFFVGGEVSGTFNQNGVQSIDGSMSVAGFTLNFGDASVSRSIASASKTFNLFSFSGSISIENVVELDKKFHGGSGIDGLRTSNNQMNAYMRMRAHSIKQNNKHNLIGKTVRSLKALQGQ